MKIETERLIIRTIAALDAEALYRIKMDEMVMEYIPDFLERDVTLEQVNQWIDRFQELEQSDDIDASRAFAIELKSNHEVIGTLSFRKNVMLHEYELGWQMLGTYSRNGYASEAASAWSDWFCMNYKKEYLIVVMDTDNPASYKTALKSGFKLFEKRTVYDYMYGRYCDDYYYFRKYHPNSKLKGKFYGDLVYTGRSVNI